jgi:hypothetical protein
MGNLRVALSPQTLPAHLPVDAEIYADIVLSLTDMGHERSFDAIRHMLDRQ